MTDYQKMYAALFHKVTEAIELLQEAQRETEEMYLASETPDLVLLDPHNHLLEGGNTGETE